MQVLLSSKLKNEILSIKLKNVSYPVLLDPVVSDRIVSLLVIAVHVCVWLSCPLLAAQSALPRSLVQPRPPLLLGTVMLHLPVQLSLQGALCCICGLGSWGPLSPLIRALGHFLTPGLVSRLVFCPSSLSVAPFPETCQFCCPLDVSNLPPVSALGRYQLVVTVGLVFSRSSTTYVLELLFQRISTTGA